MSLTVNLRRLVGYLNVHSGLRGIPSDIKMGSLASAVSLMK